MRPIRLATPGLATALTIFLIAYASVAGGYQAAGSGDPPELNLTQSFENASADVESRTDTALEAIVTGSTQQLFDLAAWVAQTSIDFGYRHPQAAWWYLRTSPFVVAGSLLLYGYDWWQEIRRGGPP